MKKVSIRSKDLKKHNHEMKEKGMQPQQLLTLSIEVCSTIL